jgi:hypothetical protein
MRTWIDRLLRRPDPADRPPPVAAEPRGFSQVEIKRAQLDRLAAGMDSASPQMRVTLRTIAERIEGEIRDMEAG